MTGTRMLVFREGLHGLDLVLFFCFSTYKWTVSLVWQQTFWYIQSVGFSCLCCCWSGNQPERGFKADLKKQWKYMFGFLFCFLSLSILSLFSHYRWALLSTPAIFLVYSIHTHTLVNQSAFDRRLHHAYYICGITKPARRKLVSVLFPPASHPLVILCI